MARMTQKRRDEILADITMKLLRDFPIGSRVRLTREAEKMFPRYKGVTGKIVGYFAGVSPKLIWDGRKTPTGYHPGFLRRVRH